MNQNTYTVVKGEAKCINRGFDTLRKNAVVKKIRTIEYEQGKKRKFNLVNIEEFDPVFNKYTPIGQYWADVVTGTLYHPQTGECQSSVQISLIVD